MIRWRVNEIGLMKHELFFNIRAKKTYLQRYEKTLMRWGSGLFWVYIIQCIIGILLSLGYIFAFDTGLPTISYLWWETSHGSFLIRLHSEFGNLLFFFLYSHIFTKLWMSIDASDADSYITWITGGIIFIFTYITGVTGAIIPCSILSEVTATIAGSAINSIVYVKFDFLETVLVPGMALNEEAIWRTYVVHAMLPLLTLIIGIYHMLLLHQNKYTAGGGLKRMGWAPRMRETRRWRYVNRYWSRSFGSWYRLTVLFLIIRFVCDISWPGFMSVLYSFANFEYWPINENIDFVLAIPHWYLRPLMGALVTIPHHYLGFVYIGCFFVLVFLIPWLGENNDDDAWGFSDAADNEGWVTNRWDITNGFIFLLCMFGSMFTTAVVPTGKYFVSIGSMDGLVSSYWVLILYLLFLVRTSFYILRLFFSGFRIYKCAN